MWFDAFYVSMLSEKHTNQVKTISVKAFCVGLISNVKSDEFK